MRSGIHDLHWSLPGSHQTESQPSPLAIVSSCSLMGGATKKGVARTFLESIVRNENGITVKELKDFVKDWPEGDEGGAAFEVFFRDESGALLRVKELRELSLKKGGKGLANICLAVH